MRRFACLILLVVTCLVPVVECVAALRAGVATADITPPMGERVVGSFSPVPATSVHDPLNARCLLLDDGTTKIGFVVCDNLGIPRAVYDEARKLIAEETDFPAANLLMSATHTHSGTRAESPRFAPLLARGIANAVKHAAARMQPAQLAFGSVDEPSEVFNRRWYVSDREFLRSPFGGYDTVRMNPPRGNKALVRPAGPIDPEVAFLSVQTTDGRPLGLLANYSLHYVGGVNKGEISADYFAIFARRIGEMLNARTDGDQPFVGIMSNGTSGDINNINFKQRGGKSYEKYEKMTEVAEHVAEKVFSTYADLEHNDSVRLDTATREITLRFRKPDAQLKEYLKTVRARPEGEDKFHRHELTYADRVQRLVDGPDDVSIPIQVHRIGNVSVAAVPFETFVEIGLEIKTRSPFENAFTIELANDSHGYLPTVEQHKLQGYETWMGTCRVQKDAADLITKTVLELMHELHAR